MVTNKSYKILLNENVKLKSQLDNLNKIVNVKSDAKSITSDFINQILEIISTSDRNIAIYARIVNSYAEYGYKINDDTYIPLIINADGGIYSEKACERRTSYLIFLKCILLNNPYYKNVSIDNQIGDKWFNYNGDTD